VVALVRLDGAAGDADVVADDEVIFTDLGGEVLCEPEDRAGLRRCLPVAAAELAA
jgi:hypothetical protein